ncbi:MAG: hypothetical protein SNJ75_00935 [Gemmataceae bacterium]
MLVAGVLTQLGLGFSASLQAQSPGDSAMSPMVSTASDPKSDARAKLLRGRALLSQGNLEAAQQVAEEVDKSSLTFSYNEDSPAKLKADIEKTRNDPKAMLKAARAAMERKDYDQAERYARAAEKSSGLFSFTGFNDTPAKVLKDIETARRSAGTGSTTSHSKTSTSLVEREQAARNLIKQARSAMVAKKWAEARSHANKAAALNVKFGWWDDSPEKILADLDRLEGEKEPSNLGSAKLSPSSSYPVPRTKTEAVQLLADARKALTQGRIDEAAAMAQRCKSATGLSWGLFEDTPDSVSRDVAKARQKRDRQEATRLLAEGRRLLAQGDHEGASRCAYKSQTLFNAYSAWDLGDRPSKLLADCQMAKSRATSVPSMPGAVVRTDNKPSPATLPGPMPGTPAPNTTALTTPPPSVPRPMVPEVNEKLRAQQLVAEAMRLQSEGKLIEAKNKVSEAMKLRAVFAADEMSPALVYQQLAAAALHRVETMTRESREMVGRGVDASIATARLQEARALAVAFKHDTAGIDAAMARLQGGQTTALPGSRPSVLPGSGAPITTVSHQPQAGSGNPTLGAQLLDKARMELRKGELATARRMVEEALAGNHGVQDQAMDLMRTIDAEEFNQKRLTAKRAFDAAESAYRRREYAQAQAMFGAIDVKLLDAGRLARLREINLTPEMSPSATPTSKPGTAIVSDQQPGSGFKPVNNEEPLLPPTLAQGNQPGKATVSDSTPDLQDEYKQRQTALFQMMRAKSLDAMTQSGEKFRTGQMAAALEILQDYLAEVAESKLDESQVKLLTRAVEARLNQYRLVKAQKDMLASQTAARNAPMERVKASKQAEEIKQKNIAELMRQYNTKFQANDLAGAVAVAQRARDLDPDNPVITAALTIAQNKRNLDDYNKVKNSRTEMGRVALNDAEHQPGSEAVKTGVAFDKERWEEVRKREPYGAQRIGRVGSKERAIESKLLTPVNLNFENTPLKQVIDDLRELHALNIYIDTPALQAQGTALESPITIRLDQVSLKSALNLILREVRLTYVIKDEVLQITTKENARGKLIPVTYQIADLVVPMEQHVPMMNPASSNNSSMPIQFTPTPSMTGPSLTNGQAVGSPNGPISGSPGDPVVVKQQVGNTQEAQLIKLIQESIAPESWVDVGGAGTIAYHPVTFGLVVNQTPDIQEQIQDLLQALRRLQDQSVSIEVRLITVTEDFFERIGVNFAMNILTDKQNRSFEPQLLQGVFVSDPNRFINAFNPKRFIAGLTPAGTLTPTLDIPITQQSFYQTFPTFGRYTGGGLNVGLAFLSDIQVFLMLEALQGDTRSNVMQAPKITCANGQSALIQIASQQVLLTGVQVVGLPGGQFAFQPQFTPSPDGGNVLLTVQPLITDDRRFVRISAPLQLSSVAPGPIPVFPLVVPLFTSLDGLQSGQPVVFTQYIQQPRVTFLSVQTEVRIPDGGTVVLGGLKRMAEARTEFGPPVLSKIPYVNRLFRNVGYGKETESLLIMISARIIVLAEEQERATGFRDQAAIPNP